MQAHFNIKEPASRPMILAETAKKKKLKRMLELETDFQHSLR